MMLDTMPVKEVHALHVVRADDADIVPAVVEATSPADDLPLSMVIRPAVLSLYTSNCNLGGSIFSAVRAVAGSDFESAVPMADSSEPVPTIPLSTSVPKGNDLPGSIHAVPDGPARPDHPGSVVIAVMVATLLLAQSQNR